MSQYVTVLKYIWEPGLGHGYLLWEYLLLFSVSVTINEKNDKAWDPPKRISKPVSTSPNSRKNSFANE